MWIDAAKFRWCFKKGHRFSVYGVVVCDDSDHMQANVLQLSNDAAKNSVQLLRIDLINWKNMNNIFSGTKAGFAS